MKIRRERVIENLRAACAVIRAAGNTSEDLDEVRHAKEVQESSILLLLRFEAEEQADELLALDRRRRELVTSLQAFSYGEFAAGTMAHSILESRKVSGALVMAGQPDELTDSVTRAAAEWKARFEAITSGETELEAQQ